MSLTLGVTPARGGMLPVIGLAAAGLGVFALIAWPIGDATPSVGAQSLPVVAARTGTFLTKAPFDPRHRAETSTGLVIAPNAPVQAPAPQQLVLGILVDGGNRTALLATDPTHWHAEGETVDGWLIRHIEPETVTLTRGADIRVLTYGAALSSLSR
jgi:hypothetical protein